MQKRAVAVAFAAAVVGLAACGSSDTTTTPTPKPVVNKIVNFVATLTPAGELSTTLVGNPTGSGTFTATLDTTTNIFTYNTTFSGLTTNVNNGHIHGPFIPGQATTTGTVILNFNPAATGAAPGATFTGFGSGTSGSAIGTIVLNAATQISANVNGDSLRKLLLAGLTYANIHTTNNPGGEIRGQITVKP
jgi:hypothetical protein